MIQLENKWGADYLVFDEPITINRTTIKTIGGLLFTPGDKITKIGSKKRSCFEMLRGFMEYQGIWENYRDHKPYAIFHCPDHDNELDRFSYRYAFAVAFAKNGTMYCFVIGPGGHKGCRDLVADSITLFETI